MTCENETAILVWMALKPPIGASLLGTGNLNVKFMCAKACLVLGLRDLSQSLALRAKSLDEK
jgi:hypothetical protein